MSVESPSDQSSGQSTDEAGTPCLVCTALLVVATVFAGFGSSSSYTNQGLGMVAALGFAAVACAILSVRQAVMEAK